MNPTESLEGALTDFRSFVEVSWPVVGKLLPLGIDGTSFAFATVEDWLQANWELLVEARVLRPLQFFPPYYEGSDIHESGRISNTGVAVATHRIICILRADSTDLITHESCPAGRYQFSSFGHIASDGLIRPTPPLGAAICIDDPDGTETDRAFGLTDVEFELETINWPILA